MITVTVQPGACRGTADITVASYQLVRQHEHYFKLAWQPQAGRAVPGQPAVSRAAAAAGRGPTRATGDQPEFQVQRVLVA